MTYGYDTRIAKLSDLIRINRVSRPFPTKKIAFLKKIHIIHTDFIKIKRKQKIEKVLLYYYLSFFSCINNSNLKDSKNKNLPVIVTIAEIYQAEMYFNLFYAGVSESQKLDLYIPMLGNKPLPLIIWIYGGGFKFGDKSDRIQHILNAVKRGYAVASVNYRLSTEAHFPAAINDVKAAIRYLKANAEKYTLNPDAFATWGESAGGNLSVLAALSGGDTIGKNDTLSNINESDRVQASVDWYGPGAFEKIDDDFKILGITPKMGMTSHEDSFESLYLGKTLGTSDAVSLEYAANPVNYIDKNDPPVFIQHGSLDENIPYLQSLELSKALAGEIGDDKVQFDLIKDAYHGGREFTSEENINRVLDFLDKYIK